MRILQGIEDGAPGNTRTRIHGSGALSTFIQFFIFKSSYVYVYILHSTPARAAGPGRGPRAFSNLFDIARS